MPRHENAPVATLRFPAAEAAEPAARIAELAATPEIKTSDREYSRSVENESQERTSGYWNGNVVRDWCRAGRATKSGSHQSSRFHHHHHSDCGRARNLQCGGHQLREHDRTISIGGFEPQQVGEPALASQAVKDIHFWDQISTANHEVRNIGPVRREICRGSAYRKEFAKPRLRILEAVPESPQTEPES